MANFCWKRVLSSFFLYFLRSSYMQGWRAIYFSCISMWLKLPKGWRVGSQKIYCFAHKILVFHLFFTFFSLFFFSLFFFSHNFAWYHLQCDRYDLNVKLLIFCKNFYKVHSVEVWSQDPVNKNNSSSLIITNMELRFEPCVLNLIWKWGAKDPKRREDHLIFNNFGVKKFSLKNTPKKKLWCLNVIIS
jgi:hypothetical protein